VHEAADNQLLDPAIAASIDNVPGAKQKGQRVGNWLTTAQAQHLLNAPDTTTLKGLRDVALLAVALGCGLRRSEIVSLTLRRFNNVKGAGQLLT
jgi:site-specific recombinase XerD